MLDVSEIALRLPAEQYGIVNISVANLRKQAVFQSELGNQLLLGTIVPIYEQQNGFYYVENWDGYRGWVSAVSLVIVNRTEAEAWHDAAKVVFQENYGIVRSAPAGECEGVTDLVAAALLKKTGGDGKQTKVELPDGRTGFVKTSHVRDENGPGLSANQENLVKLAKRFIGIPYHWGGTSTKGFDCSGFVQTVFRILDVVMPRDAAEMALQGEEIPAAELQVGDLLFFGKTTRRITHVALSLGGALYIHADGMVHLNSLDPQVPLYDADRHKTLVKTKRPAWKMS